MRDNIYKPYTMNYVGCPFIVASNEIPQPKHAYDVKFYTNIWDPVVKRTHFVYLHQQHEGRNRFPYNECELAAALLWIKQNDKVIERARFVDDLLPTVTETELLWDWAR